MHYISFTVTPSTKSLVATIAVSLLAASLAFPQAVKAYATTEQSVTQITDTTFLFQVTYRFNFLNRSMRTPILATRVTESNISSPLLQYSLRDAAGEALTVGNSAALVLSTASIEDNQYFLPDKTPGFFTLIALVELPPEAVAAGGEASLQIDWLPFTLINDGAEQLSRVHENDLTGHRTPVITW